MTALFAFTDFAPLISTFGRGYTTAVRSFVEKYTIVQTWKLNPLIRGIITEGRLAASYINKGFEWMAETSQFFRKFDFYNLKKQLIVSLKTVNAEKAFDFKAVFKNVEELKL